MLHRHPTGHHATRTAARGGRGTLATSDRMWHRQEGTLAAGAGVSGGRTALWSLIGRSSKARSGNVVPGSELAASHDRCDGVRSHLRAAARSPLSPSLTRARSCATIFVAFYNSVNVNAVSHEKTQARDKYKKYNRNSTVTAALTEYANANQRLTYVYVSWCLFGQFTYSAVLSHCTNMHANAPAHRCKRSLLPFRKCIGMRRVLRCGDHRDLGDLLA